MSIVYAYEHFVNIDQKKFGVKIVLHQGETLNPINKTVYYNKGFRHEQFSKWRWYFRYRMSLFQVQHPRWYAEMTFFDYLEVPSDVEEKKRYKDKISARKRKLTIARTKTENYKASWDSIFPIDDDPTYLSALAKIGEYETNLNQFIKEYQQKYESNNI